MNIPIDHEEIIISTNERKTEKEKYIKEIEDMKKKEEEIKRKKKEERNKFFYEYNDKRIKIKDIFIPKLKYEKDNFYDVIIKMDLLNELLIDGWEICCSKFYENDKYIKNEEFIPIGVIGESKKGKSFLLGKICNIDLPEGFSQKTEGISVKYLFIDQMKCALIDTTGLKKPIINDNKNEKYLKKFIKEDIEMKIEENGDREINIQEIKIKNENLFYRCLKKITTDKQITDQFIRDFVLNKSKITLIVVRQMTISEQLLINNIIEANNNYENEDIIIIHNLFNFVKIKQVEYYICDVLKHSIYFNLEEREMTELEDDLFKDFNKKYFIERYYNEDTKKTNVIRHLIFANDSKESEAGNYYNYSTIQFIRNIIESYSNPRTFDVIEELKEFLIQESNKYFKLNEEQKKEDKIDEMPIEKENIIIEEKNNENNKKNETKTYLMKIKEIPNLHLKDFQFEDKFKYFGKAFIPRYLYYKEFINEDFFNKKNENINDENKYEKKNKEKKKIEVLIIAIELAGKIKNFRQKIIKRNEKFYAFITGTKELQKNNKMFNYESNIKENEFRIEFEIKMDKLVKNKLKKCTINDGILKLYYEIIASKEEKYIDEIKINLQKKESEKKSYKISEKKINENKNKDEKKKKEYKKKDEKKKSKKRFKLDNNSEESSSEDFI